MDTTAEPQTVLVITDSPGDLRLLTTFVQQLPLPVRLHSVEDGEKAMAFLRQAGEYAQAPRPDIILLDPDIPRKTGWEVLREIKADPRLRRIPVIVFTSSERDEEIRIAYDLNANGYLVKPLTLEEWMQKLEVLFQFWLQTARRSRE